MKDGLKVLSPTVNIQTWLRKLLLNHYHKWVITFSAQSGYEAGAFEGTCIWVQYGDPLVPASLSGEGHAVLQGSEGFEGQTLKIAMEFPPVPAVWKGYLMER